MCYRLVPLLSLAAAMALSAPVAAAPDNQLFWVCAGYFEARTDTAVASHGIRVYRERFLATKTGAVRRAMFVFPVAYHAMRDHLRSQTATRFGEANFTVHDAFDPATDLSTSEKKSPVRQQSLKPGDQVATLPGGGTDGNAVAAARMITNHYNAVPSKNGWSELHMMVFDGTKIVGPDSTLVVVWRFDSAEEWGTGESGSLLNFGRHRTASTFVTSAEFELMERLRKLYRSPFGVVALADQGSLQQNEDALASARAWLKRYKAEPSDKHQAANPGKCR